MKRRDARPRPPLETLRVLELGENVAVPAGAAFLADLGADVVKIETPEGDPARRRPGFDAFNRGKRSAIWASGDEGARAALARAAAGADLILVDEAWLRRLESAGDALDQLERAGSAVVCRVPHSGAAGRAVPTDEDAFAAASGIMWVQPGHEPGPSRYAFPALGVFTGMLAAAGGIAGLLAREREGRVPRVEVPQAAVAALLVGLVGTTAKGTGLGIAIRTRSPLGQHQSYRCYPAKDGWLCVACTSPDFYSRFCLSLDLPELVTDPRFENAPWAVPAEHQPAQAAALGSRIAELSVAECLARFAAFDVPAQPVQDVETYLRSSLATDNELLLDAGDLRLMRFPGTVDGWRQTHVAAAPALGSAGPLAALEWEPRPALPRGPVIRAPLAGVRVVDFTTYLAGPVCATLLGDLGADVIKVEPTAGEGLRSSGLSCLGINRGKRGLALDLRSEACRPIVDALVDRTDVVLTGFRPGVEERLGLTYERLSELNPRVVKCSFNGYGACREHASRPSFDPLIQALSGQMRLQGLPDGTPSFFLISLNDFGAGFLGVLVVLTELWQRERGAGGSSSELTQAAVALHLIADTVASLERGGERPVSDSRGRDALHRLYASQDGWVYLQASEHLSTEAALRLSLERLGATDPGTMDLGPRGPVAEVLASAIASCPTAELQRRSDDSLTLVPVGLPFPIVPEAPLFAEVDCLWRYQHPFFGDLSSVGRVLRIAGCDAALRPGPWIGEHSREILREVGLPEAEVERLYAAGLVASPVPDFARSAPRRTSSSGG